MLESSVAGSRDDGFLTHNGVHTGELAEEDHHIGVNSCTASTRIGEQLSPSEPALRARALAALLLDGQTHLEEFSLGLKILEATDALPDSVSFDFPALVHQETRRLRKEEHADEKNGGEDDRGTEHVAPIAGDVEKDGSHNIAENFAECNIELVKGDKVATPFAGNGFGDVDGDGTTVE